MSEPHSPVQPGDVVAGKFRVERVLGAGGMGVVVMAHHLDLDRRVALKFLLPRALHRPEFVARFSREARAAAKLESEHIARVLDVGALPDGAPYIVMEYLEGEDLASLLSRRRALPIEEAVGYVIEACEAVAEAHALGIIHRDLKPSNLFLAQRPSRLPILKVVDFGLSKLTGSAEEQVTSDSSILGSPVYMSPEQLMAPRTVDARADLWALGIVLYELLCARAPFRSERMPELVADIMHAPPNPLDEHRSDVPHGLQAAIARCLQKKAADRYANVSEFARDLTPFCPPRHIASLDRIGQLSGRLATPTRDVPVTTALPASDIGSSSPPKGTESVSGSAQPIRERPPIAATRTLRSESGRRSMWTWRVALGGGFVLIAMAASRMFLWPSVPVGRDWPREASASPTRTEGSTATPVGPRFADDGHGPALEAGRAPEDTPTIAHVPERPVPSAWPVPLGDVPRPPRNAPGVHDAGATLQGRPDSVAPADRPSPPDGVAPADRPSPPDGVAPADRPSPPDGPTPAAHPFPTNAGPSPRPSPSGSSPRPAVDALSRLKVL